MVYKFIYISVLISVGFPSWIQNPSPILTRSFDAKSTALGGINFLEKSNISSVQFSYSTSDENIFEESSILLHKGNRSYYFSYFGIPDLDNTIDAWSDNGDGVPTSDEIDYTRITSFDYQSFSFTYPFQLSISNVEVWPTFSLSSLYEESAYSVEISISKRMGYKNIKFLFFVHDVVSSKWWSTNRSEMYLPFIELMVSSVHNNMKLLLDAILSSSELNGRIGIDFYIHNNLSLRGGYESSGVFSFGAEIKLNFIELGIAVIPSDIEYPFKPTQQFTLKLLTHKAWSMAKKLSP